MNKDLEEIVGLYRYIFKKMASGKNYMYQRGVRKERKIVNEARAKGYIALRSAGSHSPIDVVIIDIYNKQIYLIQSKPIDFPDRDKDKIYAQFPDINGTYKVVFTVE